MTGKRIYMAVLALLCVLTVVLLSAGAVRIYREGAARKAEHPLESVYTAEAVRREFAAAAPVLFIAVGMAAAGLILGIRDERQDRGVKDIRSERDLLLRRAAEPDSALQAETARQGRIRLAGRTAFGACMIPVLIYVLNKNHFPAEDPEAMIHSMAAGVFPWIVCSIACLMIASVLESRSIRRQIERAKLLLKEEGGRPKPQPESRPDAGDTSKALFETKGAAGAKKRGLLQAAVLAAAAVLIIAGMFNGSMTDVLVKATNICTECIGLG